MKKVIKFIFIFLISICLLFWLARNTWKLFGFKYCDPVTIQTVEIEDNNVKIEGRDTNLIPKGCIGYYYEINDDCLYIGFNFSSIFGFFDTSHFEVNIQTDKPISKVIVKTNSSQQIVYDINN